MEIGRNAFFACQNLKRAVFRGASGRSTWEVGWSRVYDSDFPSPPAAAELLLKGERWTRGDLRELNAELRRKGLDRV